MDLATILLIVQFLRIFSLKRKYTHTVERTTNPHQLLAKFSVGNDHYFLFKSISPRKRLN